MSSGLASIPSKALCNISTGAWKTLTTVAGVHCFGQNPGGPSPPASGSPPTTGASTGGESRSDLSGMIGGLGLEPPVVTHGAPPSTTTTTTPTETAKTSPVAASRKLVAPRPLEAEPRRATPLQTVAVPSTRSGRAAGFGSLFMKIGWAKLTQRGDSSTMIPLEGHEMIASTLCRMRGAVLKLGQMLSIQDESTVPPAISSLFEKVRNSAFAMPEHQLDQAMADALGTAQWRDKFVDFNTEPLAAASIGQVHFARVNPNSPLLSATDAPNTAESLPDVLPTVPAVVKVQYPGVATSIDSDVANLRMLMKMNILPAGVFVGNILTELKQELSLECQYTIEAAKQIRYRDHVLADPYLSSLFYVPKVFDHLTTDNILCSEFVAGNPIDLIGPGKLHELPLADRNRICEGMMRLTLTELFVWRFMQTDPNYANFLVDVDSKGAAPRVNLLDFGAAREYDQDFVVDYLDVVTAAQKEDRATIIDRSIKLGFLTGHECNEMLEAHSQSVMLLGKPFRGNASGGVFDYTAENLPQQLQKLVPTMLKLRLRPPPTPIYSLHRRISGTILLSTQLGTTYNVRDLFEEAAEKARRNAASVGKKSSMTS